MSDVWASFPTTSPSRPRSLLNPSAGFRTDGSPLKLTSLPSTHVEIMQDEWNDAIEAHYRGATFSNLPFSPSQPLSQTLPPGFELILVINGLVSVPIQVMQDERRDAGEPHHGGARLEGQLTPRAALSLATGTRHKST